MSEKTISLKGLEAWAIKKGRPAGYMQEVMRHAKRVTGTHVTWDEKVFLELRCKYDALAAAHLAPPSSQFPPVTEDIWQHRLWHQIHSRPILCPDPRIDRAWVQRCTKKIPCGACKDHWQELIRELPPDLSSRDRYFAWTVKIHNRVNERLGKPIMPLERAKTIHRFAPGPCFKTDDGRVAALENQFRDKAIFLIAGGPSLAQADLEALRQPGVLTLGLNNAAKLIRPNFWACVDKPTNFLASVWLDPAITKFVPDCHRNKTLHDSEHGRDIDVTVGQCPNVWLYPRTREKDAERFLASKTVPWSFGKRQSVMIASLKILYVLGFSEIYLLGVDFNMGAEKQYAFDQSKGKKAQDYNNESYAAMMQQFAELKAWLDQAGVKVFNCNPASALKVFPHLSAAAGIRQCRQTNLRGIDPAAEKTEGLYR